MAAVLSPPMSQFQTQQADFLHQLLSNSSSSSALIRPTAPQSRPPLFPPQKHAPAAAATSAAVTVVPNLVAKGDEAGVWIEELEKPLSATNSALPPRFVARSQHSNDQGGVWQFETSDAAIEKRAPLSKRSMARVVRVFYNAKNLLYRIQYRSSYQITGMYVQVDGRLVEWPEKPRPPPPPPPPAPISGPDGEDEEDENGDGDYIPNRPTPRRAAAQAARTEIAAVLDTEEAAAAEDAAAAAAAAENRHKPSPPSSSSSSSSSSSNHSNRVGGGNGIVRELWKVSDAEQNSAVNAELAKSKTGFRGDYPDGAPPVLTSDQQAYRNTRPKARYFIYNFRTRAPLLLAQTVQPPALTEAESAACILFDGAFMYEFNNKEDMETFWKRKYFPDVLPVGHGNSSSGGSGAGHAAEREDERKLWGTEFAGEPAKGNNKRKVSPSRANPASRGKRRKKDKTDPSSGAKEANSGPDGDEFRPDAAGQAILDEEDELERKLLDEELKEEEDDDTAADSISLENEKVEVKSDAGKALERKAEALQERWKALKPDMNLKPYMDGLLYGSAQEKRGWESDVRRRLRDPSFAKDPRLYVDSLMAGKLAHQIPIPVQILDSILQRASEDVVDDSKTPTTAAFPSSSSSSSSSSLSSRIELLPSMTRPVAAAASAILNTANLQRAMMPRVQAGIESQRYVSSDQSLEAIDFERRQREASKPVAVTAITPSCPQVPPPPPPLPASSTPSAFGAGSGSGTSLPPTQAPNNPPSLIESGGWLDTSDPSANTAQFFQTAKSVPVARPGLARPPLRASSSSSSGAAAAAVGEQPGSVRPQVPAEYEDTYEEKIAKKAVLEYQQKLLAKHCVCPVCLSTMRGPVNHICGHSMCFRCSQQVLRTTCKCPICRCLFTQAIPASTSYTMINIINDLNGTDWQFEREKTAARQEFLIFDRKADQMAIVEDAVKSWRERGVTNGLMLTRLNRLDVRETLAEFKSRNSNPDCDVHIVGDDLVVCGKGTDPSVLMRSTGDDNE